MGQERSRINIALIARVILVLIIALIVGATLFGFFKLHTNGRTALREAKNVRLALRAADIEMYGMGKTIFNASRKNGFEVGAKERAEALYKPEGKYKLTSYNKKKHELTGFIYENGNYIVTFEMDGNNILWDVDYRLNLYTYDEKSDIVNGTGE